MAQPMAVDAGGGGTGGSQAADASTAPWVEKYRPRTVDDVSHQGEVVAALRRSMDTGNLPHLLFYGGPGTGKTTTALAIARQMYGPDLMKTRILELNASDQRGIGVVRNKIKAFASAAVGEPAPGYPSPPYKLLILDEADSMTEDAQNALRRTMEAYSRVTRFVFICNYVSRIIGPIASRCAKFRFQPVDGESATKRLRFIAESEGVQVEEGVYEKVLELSGGDLRKAINTLQSAARLRHGSAVTAEAVVRSCGQVESGVADALWKKVCSKSFDDMHKEVEATVADGHSVLQVLQLLQDAAMQGGRAPPLAAAAPAARPLAAQALTSRVARRAPRCNHQPARAAVVAEEESIAEMHAASICVRLAAAEKRLLDGADEFLQLLDVCSFAQRTLQGLPQVSMPMHA